MMRGSDDPQLRDARGIAGSAVPVAQRDFGVGSQILRDLGIARLRLLTNQAKALPGLEAFGIEIVERVALR
jgi:3,4-dihydroxy 2-butanone 4-phosphate synthase/GTP cyclohydrolase II